MPDFASTDELIRELRAGNPVVLVDDEGPENTGDVVAAAETVTPELINFLSVHARPGGIIALALTAQRCSELALEPQGFEPDTHTGTALMTTVDAAAGVSTGISAADRAVTIRKALAADCRPEDLARPGHVYTLRARPGGCLVRAGTTEAGCDLAALAGFKPAAVMCAIHDESGELARLDRVRAFAAEHRLKLGTIADLIRRRTRSERLIRRVDTSVVETPYGKFDVVVYHSTVDDLPHLALCKGGVGIADATGEVPENPDPVLVRVHSECLTGEVFGSKRCECGPQLAYALARIEQEGKGALIYLRQEGRGIGLANKLHAYRLQEDGLDTVDANTRLGLPPDKRDYGIGSQMIRDLGLRRLRLMSNNPSKIHGLLGYGLEVVERLPCSVGAGEHNRAYLRTKRDRMGHLLP